jgi:hypothetical protein
MRVLKLDPRPPAFDSVASATLDEDAAGQLVDDIECAEWRAIAPGLVSDAPELAFVDGVQQVEARVSAEGEGWPTPGHIVSYAAGAMCASRTPHLHHVMVGRRVILGGGRSAMAVRVVAQNGTFEYTPESSAGDDPDGLDQKLNALRSELEALVVRRALDDGIGLVVVDGRLPPITRANAVGLIKTPHRVPLTKAEQIDVLMALNTGERSPMFVRQRSDRRYYSWFVCLRKPGPSDIAASGLALLEMDDSVPESTARRTADLTAAVLPAYASTPHRDARAPQNLLPIGRLERELRHRLGEPDYMRRLLNKAFSEEVQAWSP